MGLSYYVNTCTIYFKPLPNMEKTTISKTLSFIFSKTLFIIIIYKQKTQNTRINYIIIGCVIYYYFFSNGFNKYTITGKNSLIALLNDIK